MILYQHTYVPFNFHDKLQCIKAILGYWLGNNSYQVKILKVESLFQALENL